MRAGGVNLALHTIRNTVFQAGNESARAHRCKGVGIALHVPFQCCLFFLVFLVLVGGILAADFEMEFAIPEKVEIILSTGAVDLGTPITLQPGRVYFEKPVALRLDFRCNRPTEWEVRLCGEDFRAGANTISISRLEWKTENSIYRSMPPAGEYTVLASWRDYPDQVAAWHGKEISYRLALLGDEYEGTYSSVITYTLFVP
jgi:hypothetical protein